MKKSVILLLIVLLSASIAPAQNKKNARLWDAKSKSNILVGLCDRKELTKNDFGIYYSSEYERYQPSQKYNNKLRDKIKWVDIVVVFGEWCGDSKVQVPRFLKVLDRAKLPKVNLKIYGVKRDKKAYVTDLSNLKIKKVPTFIVFQDGKELGRIVETPKKSLEKDLWKIVKKAKVPEMANETKKKK